MLRYGQDLGCVGKPEPNPKPKSKPLKCGNGDIVGTDCGEAADSEATSQVEMRGGHGSKKQYE